MLRVDRPSDTPALALGIEQFVDVRPAVRDAQRPRLSANLLRRGDRASKGFTSAGVCEFSVVYQFRS